MKARTLLITNWLDLKHSDHQDNNVLQPLLNDCSYRRYYRCRIDDKSYIVMDSEHDNSFPQFIKIAHQFFAWGLAVPEIYKVNESEGLILMSDLGKDLYLQKLNVNTADQLYRSAFAALLVMQKKTSKSTLSLSVMGLDYIKFQLTVFQQWFLQKHLNLPLNESIQHLLLYLEKLFLQTFNAQPQVIVHVDYHSRNLLVLPDKTGIIDFQDAMLGPIVYDLVSLLQDAYISWPREQVERWLLEYQALAVEAGIMRAIDPRLFAKFFDLVGLQRHLKNLCVFARMYHRDGRSEYLADIPMLLQYILATCRRYPELAEVLEFFEGQVLQRLGDTHVFAS